MFGNLNVIIVKNRAYMPFNIKNIKMYHIDFILIYDTYIVLECYAKHFVCRI